MSRSKKKRVAPPKRIRRKDRPVYHPGPALLMALAEKGVELGTPEAVEVMAEAMMEALMEDEVRQMQAAYRGQL